MAFTYDAAGNMLSYTYDGNGNRTSEKNPLGNTTRFVYGNKPRIPHSNPQPNSFGLKVEKNYDLMGELLGGDYEK